MVAVEAELSVRLMKVPVCKIFKKLEHGQKTDTTEALPVLQQESLWVIQIILAFLLPAATAATAHKALTAV